MSDNSRFYGGNLAKTLVDLNRYMSDLAWYRELRAYFRVGGHPLRIVGEDE